jgi:hypothetical protein
LHFRFFNAFSFFTYKKKKKKKGTTLVHEMYIRDTTALT